MNEPRILLAYSARICGKVFETMEEYKIVGIIVISWFFAIIIKHAIESYIERRRFIKELERVMKRKDEEFKERLESAFKKALPEILKIMQKKKNESSKN